MYYKLTDTETRAICREKIEALEFWLRRLIDEILTASYGSYFDYQDTHGAYLINSGIRGTINKRKTDEPNRYPRLIDAVLLDDSIDIICNPNLYRKHFSDALKDAFPDGREEAKTFLKRLVYPRNCLAHANPISLRHAEQVICYSNDIIDSIKNFYFKKNMNAEYNVPLILKVTDSFGNMMYRNQLSNVHDGGIMANFLDEPRFFLRPGDVLTIEVEVDQSFNEADYIITWDSAKGLIEPLPQGKKAIINITNKQVAGQFDVQCRITSNKGWHRMFMGVDDFLLMYYKVLPPI
jgi:hypothetical protein